MNRDEPHDEDMHGPDEPVAFTTSEELHEAFETVYMRGAARTDWSVRAEEDLLPVITEKLPSTSSIESFECRADFCRLEAAHLGVQSNNEFLASLFSMEEDGPLGRTTGGFRSSGVTYDEDGRQRQVIFIARPGVRLAIQAGDV